MFNHQKTIGEIKDSRGKDYIVNYIVQNKVYVKFIRRATNDFIGKKYIITFDAKNSYNSILNKNEPIFDKEDLTQMTYATITDFQKEFIFFGKALAVNFENLVDDQKYESYQFYDSKSKIVNIGDKFEIEYLNTNPSIVIIKLDQKKDILK